MSGTLFVVATPIGNLEDLSPRARRILGEVDLIAAEDTRRTARLLSHFQIHRPVVSLHMHNEARETPRLVRRLVEGASIALVSDAGTPGIADPGMLLVRAAREQGIRVSPVPGPSAVMAALSASGLPGDRFLFLGFPPRSGAARTRWLAQLEESEVTVVLFEAPHRIRQTLADLGKLANRLIITNRELTKIYETSVEYSNTADGRGFQSRGEFVVVVSGAIKAYRDAGAIALLGARMFCCLTDDGDFTHDLAIGLTSAATGLEPAVLRKAVKKHKIALKQASGIGHS
jgi:16S rRNA (cytidine1402-2'-O)-methyltransferase